MIEVTKTQVVDAVRAIVNERPDYVYTNPNGQVAGSTFAPCYYVHTDEAGQRTPGCLVGAVLDRLGVPLAEIQAEGNTMAAREILPYLIDLGSNATNQFAYDYLGYLQQEQDNGATWGAALQQADEEFTDELAPAAA